MKKICTLLVLLVIIGFITCACKTSTKPSMIQSKRKFEQFLNPSSTNVSHDGIIDLSEGPKLKYDKSFGPKSLNFDIKIENPY